ncbi:TLC domain-containing protein 1 [Thoreauomyces humboldtii]|nr:TLC domain-containing protein 1 [Thoreauomyces humboldtii]
MSLPDPTPAQHAPKDPFCTAAGYMSFLSSLLSFLVIRHVFLPLLVVRAYPSLRMRLTTPKLRAIFNNHAVSYMHALCASILVMTVFLSHPELWKDMQGLKVGSRKGNEASRTALAFSTGYFVADCIDMLVTGVYRGNLGIWGHHIVAIGLYLTSLHTCLLYPYLLLTLLVEINSIFLHHRKVLATIYPTTMPSFPAFTYDTATNLLLWTFVPTRIAGNLYITYRVVVDRPDWEAPAWTWVTALAGMLAVDWYNWRLYRQVRASVARDRQRRGFPVAVTVGAEDVVVSAAQASSAADAARREGTGAPEGSVAAGDRAGTATLRRTAAGGGDAKEDEHWVEQSGSDFIN